MAKPAISGLLYHLLKDGRLLGVSLPIAEESLIAAFGEPRERFVENEIVVLFFGRTEISLLPGGQVCLAANFYKPARGCRALSMAPLSSRTGIYQLLDALDDADIEWEVQSSLSFGGQMTIRTEGTAALAFGLVNRELSKLTILMEREG